MAQYAKYSCSYEAGGLRQQDDREQVAPPPHSLPPYLPLLPHMKQGCLGLHLLRCPLARTHPQFLHVYRSACYGNEAEVCRVCHGNGVKHSRCLNWKFKSPPEWRCGAEDTLPSLLICRCNIPMKAINHRRRLIFEMKSADVRCERFR